MANETALKVKQVVEVLDADGMGSTKARIVKINDESVEVRWMEARWSLSTGIMLNRKGTLSIVSASRVRP